MIQRSLFAYALLATALAAAALVGCGTPSGLGSGEPAPPVAVQPHPEGLWPAWARAGTPPGDAGAAEAAQEQAPPTPLAGLPSVPVRGGLAAMKPDAIVCADPRMKAQCGRARIDLPGRAGVRPPVYRDLTGDGAPELIVAADVESGRTVVSVYTAERGKVVQVLFTGGRRLAVEAVGSDLVVRAAASDGAEQAVRYTWDGTRMSTISDEKRYRPCPRSPRSSPDLSPPGSRSTQESPAGKSSTEKSPAEEGP
ncbi:hypothetical protein [Streptomyces sp. NPDC055709]